MADTQAPLARRILDAFDAALQATTGGDLRLKRPELHRSTQLNVATRQVATWLTARNWNFTSEIQTLIDADHAEALSMNGRPVVRLPLTEAERGAVHDYLRAASAARACAPAILLGASKLATAREMRRIAARDYALRPHANPLVQWILRLQVHPTETFEVVLLLAAGANASDIERHALAEEWCETWSDLHVEARKRFELDDQPSQLLPADEAWLFEC
jgi:hypothetical protein